MSTTVEPAPVRSAQFYDDAGPFLDVLMAGYWSVLGPCVTAALQGVNASAGPVVDLGAGTGRSTVAVARALSGAEVLAVEPHPLLRAVLLAAVAADPDMASRVTVREGDASSVRLPERICAATLFNVVGHLDPDERAALWQRLAAHLAPGGRLVVNLQPPAEVTALPPTSMGEVTVGRRRYTGIAAAEPAGRDTIAWHMTYRVFEGDELVGEHQATDTWWVLTSEQLVDEVAAAGLRLRPHEVGHGVHVAIA